MSDIKTEEVKETPQDATQNQEASSEVVNVAPVEAVPFNKYGDMFAESNYAGTRLIEIKDENVENLKKELDVLQKEANPFLEEMEKLTPILDPFYTRLRELQEEIKKVQTEMAPHKEAYDGWLQKVEEIDNRALLVKNKITPIVKAIVEPQLGEFETALTMKETDGKFYVEVMDEIEEKVKAVRAAKAKKA